MRLITLSEDQVTATFISLALLLVSAYIFGTLIEKIKGPRVVGEIIGGMVLGGSCMFLLMPDLMKKIFFSYPEQGQVLNIFYQLGLVFLMFLSGYNTEIKIEKKNSKNIVLIFLGATVIPMLLAVPFAGFFKEYFIGTAGNHISFLLVFCIGVAITSIPVISKIFFDMGIMNTKFSNTVLTVAAFQDLCLWILLNIASRIAASGTIEAGQILMTVLSTLGSFVLITVISRKVRTVVTISSINLFYTISFAALLAVCGLFSLLGINIMYSAFIVGYIIRSFTGNDNKTKKSIDALKNIVFSFFVPIYFALVGIQLNVINDFSVGRFLLFFIIAFGLEFLGTWAILYFTELSGDTKMLFAVTMNARGGPGIVLATVSYGAGIISLEFFTVLILTTMLSSMTAGYFLRYKQKKDENIFDSLYHSAENVKMPV